MSKKFLFYAGRTHHFLKMNPLVKKLRLLGHEAVWLTSNNAINIDPSSEYLRKYKEDYIHVFDYHEATMLPQWVNTDRRTSMPPEVMKTIPPFWAFYSKREIAQLIVLYKQALADVDGVFILHANNFFTRPLAYVASTLGIPVFSFQEGMLRDRDQQTMKKQTMSADYCSKLFVWSNEAKKIYKKAGIDSGKIIVSGPLHLAKIDNVREERDRLRKTNGLTQDLPVVSFFLPLMTEYQGDVINDVTKLNDYCSRNGILFFARPHPMNSSLNFGAINVDRNDDSTPLLLLSNLVLTQHSTIAPEAWQLGAMVAEYSSGDVLESSGLLPKISPNNLNDIISLLQGKGDMDIEKINKWANGVMDLTLNPFEIIINEVLK